jgi:sterol desaturase/sphingolipid hydroxylase (fatty acid hydroxylase superfamily)
MLNFSQIAVGVWEHMQYGFAATLFASLVEVALPAEEKHGLRSRVRGFTYILVYYLTATTLILTLRQVVALNGAKPLITIDLRDTTGSSNLAVQALGYVVLPFAGIIVHDFLFYWFHRLQHSLPLLWRFHRVHHSVREMNAFNSYHHVSEEFFRIPFIMAPLLFIIDVQAPQLILVTLFLRSHAALVHSNSRLSFLIFKYVFVEPSYHRIHHSVEQRHWGRNFSSTFAVWDILFGTAYFAKQRETFRTGLPDQDEPHTIRAYLFPPPLPNAMPQPAIEPTTSFNPAVRSSSDG